MKNNSISTISRLALGLLMGSSSFITTAMAQANVDAPALEDVTSHTDLKVLAPTNTFYGTRGLSQTASAEALGEGRLIFGINGNWYQQQNVFAGGPNKNANIFTGTGSVSLGINRQIDAFAIFSGYGSTDYTSDQASGIGSVGGGIQGTLPFEPSAPIRMAAQVGIFQGLSKNAINTNHSDGYNYFETRTGLDFMARLVQTVVVGSEATAFKMHFNEGLVTSAETGKDALLLFATGVQYNVIPALALGLELNARTPIKEIALASDPLWMSPSVQFRTPYDINLTLGGDIALSQDRSGIAARALEPYRLYAGMAFTFDTEAGKRAEAKEEARKAAMEKRKLQLANNDLSKDLIEQNKADSLARMRQKFVNDSTAADLAAKNKQNSQVL